MVSWTVRRIAAESIVSVVIDRRRRDEIQRDYDLAGHLESPATARHGDVRASSGGLRIETAALRLPHAFHAPPSSAAASCWASNPEGTRWCGEFLAGSSGLDEHLGRSVTPDWR